MTPKRTIEFINGGTRCFGCGSCVAACPREALTLTANANGFAVPQIDTSLCVGCGNCRRACPVNFPPQAAPTDPEFLSVRHRERAVREASTSGGVFTALSDVVLGRGGAVTGAVWGDGFTVRHTVAETPAERDSMRGSKYVQSDTSGVFAEVKRLLGSGREVFFSGTPCQVAALYAFLGGRKDSLITADFICHGAPSPKVFRDYLREQEKSRGATPVRVQCRDQRQGCVPMRIGIDFADGTSYSQDCDHDPYFELFLSGILNRRVCGVCPYTHVRRISDLTFGDNWRFAAFAPEWDDNTGVSTLLVNTERGTELLRDAEPALEIRRCSLNDVDQHYLHRPGGIHPDRELFFRAWRKRGFAPVAADFTRPRPLLRRVRSRLLKILRGALRIDEKGGDA